MSTIFKRFQVYNHCGIAKKDQILFSASDPKENENVTGQKTLSGIVAVLLVVGLIGVICLQILGLGGPGTVEITNILEFDRKLMVKDLNGSSREVNRDLFRQISKSRQTEMLDAIEQLRIEAREKALSGFDKGRRVFRQEELRRYAVLALMPADNERSYDDVIDPLAVSLDLDSLTLLTQIKSGILGESPHDDYTIAITQNGMVARVNK